MIAPVPLSPSAAPVLYLYLQDPTPQGGEAPPVLRRGEGPAGPDATTDRSEVPAGPRQDQQQVDPTACLREQLPYLLGFAAIFYFLILRPQQKAEKQRKALLASVKKGERVVTNSGIHGEITQLSDQTVTLQVDQNVQLTFDRAAIGRVLSRDGSEGAAKP
jgi:preprotein translocase subunit YajC